MSDPTFLIFANKAHPLYSELKNCGETFIDLDSDEAFESKKVKDQSIDAIFDFSIVDKESKYKLLRNLSIEFDAPIVSELSCYWGDYFVGKFPKLKGALSAVFYTPTKKHEVWARDESIYHHVELLMSKLSRSIHRVNKPGLGFIFPRTLAMIINEAFFALEDKLASSGDLDTAMKYGVNYPLGAIEWAQKCGLINVVMLLDELYDMTGDPRYRASLELRRQASL